MPEPARDRERRDHYIYTKRNSMDVKILIAILTLSIKISLVFELMWKQIGDNPQSAQTAIDYYSYKWNGNMELNCLLVVRC